MYSSRICFETNCIQNVRNLGKVETLLSVLERRGQPIVYLAVDINRGYLEYDISAISQRHRNVVCQGIYGTFDDALSWCKELPSPKAFLSFGSSFFRGTLEEALATLRSWKELMQPGDIMIVGADGHCTPEYHEKIWQMYHADEAGWQQLWDNGFSVANDVLGEEWFHSADWKLDAVIDTKNICQHRFRFRAQQDLELGSSGIAFSKGDELGWLDAHKFSKALIHELCQLAGLEVVKTWQAEDSEMRRFCNSCSSNARQLTHVSSADQYLITLSDKYDNTSGPC